MMIQRLLVTVAVLLASVTQSVYAVNASPIYVKNTLPFMQGSGLPAPKPSRLSLPGSWSVTAFGNIQSHANQVDVNNESFTLDGEVHTAGGLATWGFTDRWQLSIELAAMNNTAGGLDDLIDRWHDLFGLPEGDRPFLGNDQFRFSYRDNNDSHTLTSSSSGFSDVELGLGYQLLSNNAFDVAAHLTLNLPVGSADKLTGSDKADVSFSIAISSAIDRSVNWHANLGMLAIGDNQLFGIQTEDVTWFSSAGIHWRPSQKWRWTAQVDGRGKVFKSGLSDLNSVGFQLAIAIEHTWDKRWGSAQFYFTEDISVNRSADFAFGLNWLFSL